MKHEKFGELVDDCRPKCWEVALSETKELIEKEVLGNLFRKKREECGGIQESFLQERYPVSYQTRGCA